MRKGALRPAEKPETEETQYREDQLAPIRRTCVCGGGSFAGKGLFLGFVTDTNSRPEVVIDELGACVLVWVKK